MSRRSQTIGSYDIKKYAIILSRGWKNKILAPLFKKILSSCFWSNISEFCEVFLVLWRSELSVYALKSWIVRSGWQLGERIVGWAWDGFALSENGSDMSCKQNNPTDPFTTLKLHNSWHDIFEENRIRLSPDFESIKLWKVRSGRLTDKLPYKRTKLNYYITMKKINAQLDISS